MNKKSKLNPNDMVVFSKSPICNDYVIYDIYENIDESFKMLFPFDCIKFVRVKRIKDDILLKCTEDYFENNGYSKYFKGMIRTNNSKKVKKGI